MIKGIIKKIKNLLPSNGLSRLQQDMLPFESHINESCVITKNGEIMSVLKIAPNKISVNKEGGLKDVVKNSISKHAKSLNVSFWLHTLKEKNENLIKSKSESKYMFTQKVCNEWHEVENSMNKYSSIVYLSIFTKPIEFSKINKFTIKNIYQNYDKHIEESTKAIQGLCQNIVDDIKSICQEVEVLSVKEAENGNLKSEIIDFLYRILNNEKNTCIDMEKESISSAISKNHKYLFTDRAVLSYNTKTDQEKYSTTLIVKTKSNISINNTSSILNSFKFINIWEFFTYKTNEDAFRHFKEKLKTLPVKKHVDKETRDLIMLKTESEKNPKEKSNFISSVTGVNIFGRSLQEMEDNVHQTKLELSRNGILVTREDMFLARSFLSSIPGNLYYTHRLTCTNFSNMGPFLYAYRSDITQANEYKNNKIYLYLPTIKNNPVHFGINKIRQNIIISGPAHTGKTTLTNLILSHLECDFKSIKCLSINDQFKTFFNSIGGKHFNLSLKRSENSFYTNPLSIANKIDDTAYLQNVFAILTKMYYNKDKVSDKNNKIIESVCTKIMQQKSSQSKLSDISQLWSNTFLEDVMFQWQDIGLYEFILDNHADCISSTDRVNVFVNKNITQNQSTLTLIVFMFLSATIKESNTNSIIILEDPYVLFNDVFWSKRIPDILKKANNLNITIIFLITNIKPMITEKICLDQIMSSSGIVIHSMKNKISDDYQSIFNISDIDFENINLNTGNRRFFFKNDKEKSILNLKIPDTRKLKVLSDDIEVRKTINGIQSSANYIPIQNIIDRFIDKK